ncbi:MAG: bifunctional pyr operon transcriptional regulator/uracil phosphoribosyltransferase PyrR [Halofilum sp. (in: g-proteobacteria)]|nr:bifunctional pyr operon transcriptional regulator/uracil phosphoribosyltransferase PyrR [Halofilum sp. (in: g-proteobacteria)]
MSTDAATVEGWLDRMARDITDALGPERQDLLIVGIHSGGVRVAQALHERLSPKEPLGSLDISFYRDDFSRIGLHPRVRRSELPFTLDDRTVLLVDDVLYSGRTVRAALNELFDYGRPARVLLAALVERAGHELPIRADFSGTRLDLEPGQQVRLNHEDLGLGLRDTRTGEMLDG